jgi:hypothetical protein
MTDICLELLSHPFASVAACYDGPLELFGERHVFPENVSFHGLQILFEQNRCK